MRTFGPDGVVRTALTTPSAGSPSSPVRTTVRPSIDVACERGPTAGGGAVVARAGLGVGGAALASALVRRRPRGCGVVVQAVAAVAGCVRAHRQLAGRQACGLQVLAQLGKRRSQDAARRVV